MGETKTTIGTRITLVAALAVGLLTGCGASPVAPAGAEAERRVTTAKKAAPTKAAAQPVAKAAPTAPVGPAGQAAIAPAGEAAAAGGAAAASAKVDAPAKAEAPAPRVTLVTPPREQVRAFRFRDPEGQLVDFRLAPASGVVTFRLQAPASGVLVGKAKVELGGVAKPVVVELAVDELAWPARLAGDVELPVPLDLYETGKVLAQNPEATRFTASVVLLAPDGTAIAGADGRPLVLSTPVSVL